MLFPGTYEERIAGLKRLLHTRLELYEWEGRAGAAGYRLDLRKKGLSGTRPMLRDPDDPAWPEGGATTTDLDVALRWVDEYVDRLGIGYFAPGAAYDLIGALAIRYLEALERTKKRTSSIFRNRSSIIKMHILPVLGSTSVLALTTARVQALLDNAVTVHAGVPADATREGILATLNGIWRTAFPKSTPPWAGKVSINGQDPTVVRRERAAAGIRYEDDDGYTPDDLRWILISAFALDLYRARYPGRHYGVTSMVDYAAFVIHNPVRLEEATFERAKDVDRKRNVIRLIGTKSEASEERWMPIQAAYEPWLERALGRCKSPEDYLLPGRPGRRAVVSTVSNTFADVLVACDRKRVGECTQIFRGTNMSMALAAGIKADQIAVFAGHEIVGDPLMSSHYLRWQAFLAGLPALAWDYVPHLGTPDGASGVGRLRAGASVHDAREPRGRRQDHVAELLCGVGPPRPAVRLGFSPWSWASRLAIPSCSATPAVPARDPPSFGRQRHVHGQGRR